MASVGEAKNVPASVTQTAERIRWSVRAEKDYKKAKDAIETENRPDVRHKHLTREEIQLAQLAFGEDDWATVVYCMSVAVQMAALRMQLVVANKEHDYKLDLTGGVLAFKRETVDVRVRLWLIRTKHGGKTALAAAETGSQKEIAPILFYPFPSQANVNKKRAELEEIILKSISVAFALAAKNSAKAKRNFLWPIQQQLGPNFAIIATVRRGPLDEEELKAQRANAANAPMPDAMPSPTKSGDEKKQKSAPASGATEQALMDNQFVVDRQLKKPIGEWLKQFGGKHLTVYADVKDTGTAEEAVKYYNDHPHPTFPAFAVTDRKKVPSLKDSDVRIEKWISRSALVTAIRPIPKDVQDSINKRKKIPQKIAAGIAVPAPLATAAAAVGAPPLHPAPPTKKKRIPGSADVIAALANDMETMKLDH